MPATNPLQQLAERGQSVWLDYISRELVTGPELGRLIAEANVTGLTSNPTIFEKAIAEGTHYDEQIHELLGQGVDNPQEVFLSLAIQDIRHACDTLRPVHDRTDGGDGFVSLELPPPLSHDTRGSVETALKYWERVNRPNLMVKVPATPEGVPAIEELIAAGVNVNVTLIFALDAYENVITAYVRGLQRRLDAHQPLDVHSVASFFVSRVDTMVDGLLDGAAQGGRRRPRTAGAPAGEGGDRQRPPGLRHLRETLPRRRFRAACATRGATCSDRCGRAPAPRTPSTAT